MGLNRAHLKHPRLFTFGSVSALLKADHALFEALDRLPFTTYINIGLESVDDATLAKIGKPQKVADVRAAFDKMIAVNQTFNNIEITANFLIGDPLSPQHHQSVAELLGSVKSAPPSKGAVYLSPFARQPDEDALLRAFFEIKRSSHLPVYIYLIQRL